MKIIVLQRIAGMIHSKRLTNLAEILEARNVDYTVVHAGEESKGNSRWHEFGLALSASNYRGKVFQYVRWFAALFRLGRRHRDDPLVAFYCIGLDSVVPVLLATSGSRARVIFDNIDNAWMSYKLPWLIREPLRLLENLAVRRSSTHIVPSAARWVFPDKRTVIVPNTPHSEVVARAKQLAQERAYVRGPNVLTVYLNGWLRSTRGVSQLRVACDELVNKGLALKVIVAGHSECEESRTLLTRDYVEYLGLVTNEQAVAEYFRSDLAFIFYDPTIPINRVAESNKWWDCVATGTPFVINEEVITGRAFFGKGAFPVPYFAINKLVALLERIYTNRDLLESARESLHSHPMEMWDITMWRVLGNSHVPEA